jgi:hypothetical protein
MFHVDISYSFRVMFRTKLKVLKLTKGNNSKIRQKRVMVLVHCTSTHWYLFTYKVSWWHLLLFQSYVLDKIFLKGEIIQKPGKIELWFFDTALPLNAIHHCMKFKQIISKGFQVMLRTIQRTDKVTTIHALPSGSIKRGPTNNNHFAVQRVV